MSAWQWVLWVAFTTVNVGVLTFTRWNLNETLRLLERRSS